MAAATVICRLNLFVSQLTKPGIIIPFGNCQQRFYAKRQKGKSAKLLGIKVSPKKAEEPKRVPWLATKIDKTIVKSTREEIEKGYEPPPVDNVWLIKKHRPPLFNIEEVLKMHRETHHPTIYNEVNALLYATLDLDMSLGENKTKQLEAFRGVIPYKNYFDPGKERKILCFCRDEQLQQEAIKAGAVLSGGAEIINMFKTNEITYNDFDHIVVHPDMLMDLVTIRGLIKHHFPTKQRGNLGADISTLVHNFVKGVDYKTEKDLFEPRYSTTDVQLGRLSMDDKAIEENLRLLLNEINERRPLDSEIPFIMSVNIWSPPSVEKLFVNFWQYLSHHDNNAMLSKYTTVNYRAKSHAT